MYQRTLSSKQEALAVTAAGDSAVGRVRSQNEDTIALFHMPNEQQAHLGRLYVLADGAGGHAAGEVASRVAVETILTVYYGLLAVEAPVAENIQEDEELLSLRGRLQQAFSVAHQRLLELAEQQPAYWGMATTCIAAVIKETHLIIAHIGDSRAYLIEDSSASSPAITCLTTDHSLVNELVKAGALSAAEAATSSSRHILTRMLGGNPENHSPLPDFVTREIAPGDTLVLCCDGLWSVITEACLASVVSHAAPQEACSQLIQAANEAGGPDNISMIVLSFTE